MSWGRDFHGEEQQKQSPELGMWEEQPRGQFGLSFVGKRESVRW